MLPVRTHLRLSTFPAAPSHFRRQLLLLAAAEGGGRRSGPGLGWKPPSLEPGRAQDPVALTFISARKPERGLPLPSLQMLSGSNDQRFEGWSPTCARFWVWGRGRNPSSSRLTAK